MVASVLQRFSLGIQRPGLVFFGADILKFEPLLIFRFRGGFVPFVGTVRLSKVLGSRGSVVFLIDASNLNLCF